MSALTPSDYAAVGSAAVSGASTAWATFAHVTEVAQFIGICVGIVSGTLAIIHVIRHWNRPPK